MQLSVKDIADNKLYLVSSNDWNLPQTEMLISGSWKS